MCYSFIYKKNKKASKPLIFDEKGAYPKIDIKNKSPKLVLDIENSNLYNRRLNKWLIIINYKIFYNNNFKASRKF